MRCDKIIFILNKNKYVFFTWLFYEWPFYFKKVDYYWGCRLNHLHTMKLSLCKVNNSTSVSGLACKEVKSLHPNNK